MLKAHSVACLLSIVLGGMSAGPAFSQNYPSKPIRIVTSPAGGGNDFPARLIARAISGPLGQQLIVDNRPTVLIVDIAAKAPPDGHTLLVTGSAHWIGPLIDKVTYDPIKDFAPITLIDRAPSVLVVHPSMPVKSVKQLVGLAKSRPGELNFSVGGPGTSNDIAAILSGRLRALAVGSAQPSALAPGVPTLEGSGLPGFLSEALHALFAPAGTPQAVVARLNQEVGRYLQSPEARDIFLKAGIETAPGTPDELTAIMRSEVARIGKVLKAAGIGVH